MTDILATIDHAIDDWNTSDDAMRWVPDVEGGAAVGYDAGGYLPPGLTPIRNDTGRPVMVMPSLEVTPEQAAAIRRAFDNLTASIAPAMRAWTEGVKRAMKGVARFARAVHDADPAACHRRMGVKRRDCSMCPVGPRPLAVDGHAYRRRTRGRR